MSGTTVSEDHVVRVERQVLIDPRPGVATEVETRTVVVDLGLGDGNIGVAQQQRIMGYQTGYGSVSPGQFK